MGYTLTLNKKALFAAMVATALPAAASAQVKIYGTIDADITSASASATPGAVDNVNSSNSIKPSPSSRTTSVGSGGMTTSYWGIGGSEDMGGGLKAFFALESFFNGSNGTTLGGSTSTFSGDVYSGSYSSTQAFFARNAYVGLESSSLGSVTAGRIVSPFFLNTVIFNPFGDSFGFSPIVYHTYLSSGSTSLRGLPSQDQGFFPYGAFTGIWSDTASNNTIRYKSPVMHGFEIEGDYSFSNKSSSDPASKDLQTYEVNAFYFGGDLSAGATYRSVYSGPDDQGLKQTSYLLSAAYDMKVLKLFGQYMQYKNDVYGLSFETVKTYQLGASAPIGPGKVMASIASSKFLYDAIAADLGGLGDKRTTWALGYDYALSKRTDIYAAYNDDKWTNSVVNPDVRTFGVGIRHNF
jgi:predicted porin